jgi:methyl-accepting chemotaxis protein
MAHFTWSLKVKASAAAAALFVVGLTIAGGLSYVAMNSATDNAHENRTSSAVKEGLEALKEVGTRMGVYASMLARHPDVVAAVKGNDTANLENVFVREFKALHAADPTVASMEVTNAKGVVVMRGHNPPKKGDDKGKLPQIMAALSGRAAGGLTVSPTSGEAAEDSVQPIKSGDVIGTLKVGSYFNSATAEELKKKTGLEVVFVAAGKITETTFPKDVNPPVPADLSKSMRSGTPVSIEADIKGTPFTGRFIHLPSDAGDGMTIGFFADRTAVQAAKSAFVSSLSLTGALAFAFILPLILWLAHLSTRQLLRLAAAMKRIADGDLNVVVPYTDNGDEVGAMANTVEVFKANAGERIRLEAQQKQAALLAATERSRLEAEQFETQKEAALRAASERKSELHKLADNFQAAVGNIVNAVSSTATELEAAASTLTHTAETTQQLSSAVAQASEKASANVQSVASATDELSASVNEIARQVQESRNIAREAVGQAEQTDARIAELSHAASRIGDVVKLITAIAEQTNLLALNATIEAARAGEAGRGFAVVAQEVKALAAQTAKATDEIGGQIAGMQMATQDSVAAIKEIGATIGRVSEIASAIAAAVDKQGSATREIGQNVQQAAQGTSQVAINIANVNRGASETGSASTQVLASARSLSAEGNKLKIEIDRFLGTVRTA